MSATKQIAVVTGGNRGIGFETCRGLAKRKFQVVLTSRDTDKGKAAAEQLQQEGLDVIYHPLDVANSESVDQFARFIREKFDRLDVLVNNAGILLDRTISVALKDYAGDSDGSILHTQVDDVRKTMETNVYGPLMLCQALIPLMKAQNYGRVVNVSSGAGQLSDMTSGYPAYRISKTALNVVTRVFAHELKGTNVLVNSVCPGWVKTDMGGSSAPRTPEQGADTIVWLATIPDNGPTGGFFRDRQPIDW